jgi:hypothetical protein
MPFFWNGENFTPAGSHWARLADKHFVVGQVYPLEVREDRSQKSHSHYFASINEAWQNLPEDVAERFPTSEHLRKFALIKAGYADERSIVCASKAEAQRIAAFVRPLDDFAIVAAREAVVCVWTAKSQSVRAMGRQDFQRSKDSVLDIIAGLIGTTPGALAQAGKAA